MLLEDVVGKQVCVSQFSGKVDRVLNKRAKAGLTFLMHDKRWRNQVHAQRERWGESWVSFE